MVDDDRLEITVLLVVRDHVELAAPEVGEKHRLKVSCGDRRDFLVVELVFENRGGGDARPFEGRRGDPGTRQPVGVDVRGQEYCFGPSKAIGTLRGSIGEFRHGCHRYLLVRTAIKTSGSDG